VGIGYGFTHVSDTEFTVVQQRQPLFTQLSDGSIQNTYTLKLLNKTKQTLAIEYAVTGLDGATVIGLDNTVSVEPGKVVPIKAWVSLPESSVKAATIQPITFTARIEDYDEIVTQYETVFASP
jgi:polyferredoxin